MVYVGGKGLKKREGWDGDKNEAENEGLWKGRFEGEVDGNGECFT
jgi:hypothetical protein